MEKIRAKKSLGQHFLTSQKVLRQILDAAEPLAGSLVVEVGPGTGVLTRGLLERGARVVVVEKDEKLAARLSEEGGEHLTVVPGDIREVDLDALVNGEPYQVVANIPYYLSGRLFRYFFEEAPRPKRLVLLVQREVALRLLNEPGEGNLLGLARELHGDARIICDVPPEAFQPPPAVDSAVIAIGLRDQPHPAAPAILRLARHAFAGRRKQLRNTLSAGLQREAAQVADLLERSQLAPTRRPQELSLDEWERLAAALEDEGALS